MGALIWQRPRLLLDLRPSSGAMGSARHSDDVFGGFEMVHEHDRCRRHATTVAALATALAAAVTPAWAQRVDSSTRRASGEPPHTILALADVSTSQNQLDAISHALAVIEQLGLRTG